MLIAWPDELAAHVVGEDLHVAGEYDEMDAELVVQRQQLLLGRGLRLRGDRDVAELDAMAAHQGLGVAVVGDHHRDVDLQAAVGRAEQQVVEAVQLLADHQQGSVGNLCAPDLVGQLEATRDLGEVRAQGLGGGLGAGKREVDPHEEPAAEPVEELLALHHVAAAPEQEPGDRVHDPGLVGAVEDQHEVAGGQAGVGGVAPAGPRELHQSPSSARRRTTNSSISARIASSRGGCS